LKMGLISCLETSVKDHQSTLRNIPEEQRSHLHRGGSLKYKHLAQFRLGWLTTSVMKSFKTSGAADIATRCRAPWGTED
jgi:hypothetical protein